MREVSAMGVAWTAGVGLGAIFFGGLWWTVAKAVSSERPAVWFVGGLALRMSLTLAGFYVVSGGQWHRLVSCLIGFLMARQFITWVTKPPTEGKRFKAGEAIHAP